MVARLESWALGFGIINWVLCLFLVWFVFFFKQKTAYEIGLGIPAEPLFRSVNFCVMEAIKLCRLDTPIIFIEARINLSRFVVTGCAAKTSATVTFPSLNLISLFAFCFNIWLNGVAS